MQQRLLAERQDFLEHLKAVGQAHECKEEKTLFISYAWPLPDVVEEYWIKESLYLLTQNLQFAGIRVYIDHFDSRFGHNTFSHMNRILNVDWVMLIGTASLLKKHNTAVKNICTELSLIQQRREQGKSFFGVCFSGQLREAFPPGLIGYTALEEIFDVGYSQFLQLLIQKIYDGKRDEKLWQKYHAKHTEYNGVMSKQMVTSWLSSKAQDVMKKLQTDNALYARQLAALELLPRKNKYAQVATMLAYDSPRYKLNHAHVLMTGLGVVWLGYGDWELLSYLAVVLICIVAIRLSYKYINFQRVDFNFPSKLEIFVARAQLFQQIEVELNRSRMVVCHGIGGAGKTSLVRHYLEYVISKDGRRYRYIAWINSERPETLAAEFKLFAQKMNVVLPEMLSEQELKYQIRQLLNDKPYGLLVLDNVEQYDHIKEYFPADRSKLRILITSRFERVAPPTVPRLSVGVMEKEEAIELIRRQSSSEEADDVLVQLADELDHLPLALAQAAAFICIYNISILDYRELYRAEREAVLKDDTMPFDSAHKSVWLTLNILFQRLSQDVDPSSTGASRLLKICSLFAPDLIPIRLLQSAMGLHDNLYKFLQMENILIRNGVLRKRNGDVKERTVYTMHRVFQEVTMTLIDEKEAPSIIQSAITGLNETRRSTGNRGRDYICLTRLIPHFDCVLTYFQKMKISEPERQEALGYAWLQYQVGHALSWIDRYDEAMQAGLIGLGIKQKVLTRDKYDKDYQVWMILYLLARSCMELGYTDKAQYYMDETLRLARNRNLIEANAEVASSLGMYSIFLWKQGKIQEAEKYEQESFLQSEKSYKVNPESGMLTANLAIAYFRKAKRAYYQSQFAESLKHMITTIEIFDRKGKDSFKRDRVSAYIFFGRIYCRLVNLRMAQKMLDDALILCEQDLQKSLHHSFAYLYWMLAFVARLSGKSREAKRYCDRSLELQLKLLRFDSRNSVFSRLYYEALVESISLSEMLAAKVPKQVTDSRVYRRQLSLIELLQQTDVENEVIVRMAKT